MLTCVSGKSGKNTDIGYDSNTASFFFLPTNVVGCCCYCCCCRQPTSTAVAAAAATRRSLRIARSFPLFQENYELLLPPKLKLEPAPAAEKEEEEAASKENRKACWMMLLLLPPPTPVLFLSTSPSDCSRCGMASLPDMRRGREREGGREGEDAEEFELQFRVEKAGKGKGD
jgi:hypothetical protein